jgi:2-methylcitrate dehydratase PrpD
VRLVAELTDGRVEEIIVHQPKGHPDVPLSDADLLNKMTWLLHDLAPAHTAKRLLELCNRLANSGDVKQLVETCKVSQT